MVEIFFVRMRNIVQRVHKRHWVLNNFLNQISVMLLEHLEYQFLMQPLHHSDPDMNKVTIVLIYLWIKILNSPRTNLRKVSE